MPREIRYDGLVAETTIISGYEGGDVEAYYARPIGAGPWGGVVIAHHLPGYDDATKEIVRRFASEGYLAICPNLYYHQFPELEPPEAAEAARAQGGIADAMALGDFAGAAAHLRRNTTANGRVAIVGYCSGGRQAFLAAASPDTLQVDAAVNCYGAVTGNWPAEHALASTEPVIDSAPRLSAPLLNLYGADDLRPSVDDAAELDRVLTSLGKVFGSHSYDDAGHAFFSTDRPGYRYSAAVDGWKRIFGWLERYLR